MPQRAGRVRYLPHDVPSISPATDVGGTAVLKHGSTFLVSDRSGDVVADACGLGLYVADTRMLSRLVLLLGGERPEVVRQDPGGAASGTLILSHGPLAVTRLRQVAAGLSERLVFQNDGDHAETVQVDLLVDADMADIFEVRGFVRARRGRLQPIEVRGDEAVLAYLGLDGRVFRTRVSAAGARIEAAERGTGAALRLHWSVPIAPGARARLAWSIQPDIAEADAGRGPRPTTRSSAAAAIGLSEPTSFRSDRPDFDRVMARAIADLDLLISPGPGPGQRYLAAGLPWFSALFGRDALLAAFGALILDPSLAVDTLRSLASLQATSDDPARDAEPGKIPHEVRGGEMARTGEVPFGRYYGSVDATPLWLILLAETFDWTGDAGLVAELWPNALAALDWLDRFGDRDGDGFIEYLRRAPDGLVQHGWKDAPEAIQDRAGRVASGPIALVEVQGYAYDARVRMARLARILGHPALAIQLEAAARRLRERFDPAFWVPDRATYALALDGTSRQMDAIGSNQGHALWTGIVSDQHAAGVAARFADPSMASGWGLRTLAAGEPGYRPLGYHTGTVWPHDTALAVAGLRRSGLDAQAARLASQLIDAAGSFPDDRLPELFGGFARDGLPGPVPYPGACAPQAWAAAAPLTMLRALLGIQPNAAEHRLTLERPMLPDGLTSLTVTGLRIGLARVDLQCTRRGESTKVEISVSSGELSVAVRD